MEKDSSKLTQSEWTRPSALGVLDPLIESQEIKETQEFRSILKMLKGAKKTNGAKGVKGSMRKGEKQWSGLVWSGHENKIYTGTNAQNLYKFA